MKLGINNKENDRLSKSWKVFFEIHKGGNHPSELQTKEPFGNPPEVSTSAIKLRGSYYMKE